MSLVNLPRNVLPGVLASFARALVPGGQLLLGERRSGAGDGRVGLYAGFIRPRVADLRVLAQLAV